MQSSLRASIDADYALMASWIPTAEAALRWAGPRVPFPFAAADLPALLAVPGGGEASYGLVDDAGQLCGYGQHWVERPGAVHLGRLIIAPHARGRGMGRVLCEQLVRMARESTAATTVTLRVFRDNVVARRLYASLGFIEVAAQSTDAVLFLQKPI